MRLAFVRFATAHPRRVLLLAALVALAAIAGTLRLTSDNSTAVFERRHGEAASFHRDFLARFGEQQALRVVLSGDELWTRDGIAAWTHLRDAVAALTDVRRVASPLDVDGVSADDPAASRERLLKDPLARGLGLVSRDGGAVSFLVETPPLASGRYAALERRLRELTAALPLEATVVGARSVELALDASSRTIETRFLPALVGLAMLLLALTFRDLGGVVTPLAFVAFCELATLGTLGWAGGRMHLVLAVLPPVLFVVALASAVHLTIRCRALEAEGLDARAATLAAYGEKGRALVFTAVAIACGFASLGTSELAPVAELGLWAAFGLGVQVTAEFTLLPALLALTAGRRAGLPERALEARLERLGRRIAGFAARRRGALVAAALALAAVAALGLDRLVAESDIVRSFQGSHPMRQAMERSEALGFGVSTVEVEIVAPDGVRFDSSESLDQLARLEERLRSVPGVLTVVGLVDLVDSIGAASPWSELLTTDELRAQALGVLAGEVEGERTRARFLTESGDATRITLFVPTAGFATVEPLAVEAERAGRELFPRAEVAATGALRLVVGFHRLLVTTLDRSLGLALAALFVLFWRLLGRPWPAAKALVPNLWPVAVLLGGMGWLGVRLDIATVMVASIVLGLAVENTIHTLARFRDESGRNGRTAAIVERLERQAPAYLLTATILVLGFGVCGLSDFAPLAHFGVLSAVAVLLALLCDLALVPALFAGEEES